MYLTHLMTLGILCWKLLQSAMQYCQDLYFGVDVFGCVYLPDTLWQVNIELLSSSDSTDSPSTHSTFVFSGSISEVIPSLLYLAFS